MLFRNRHEAGERLASALREADIVGSEPLVLALPRGGVPVAAPVAARLEAPLDVLVVRKLGMPGHAELAMGAVAAGGVRVLNEEIVRSFEIAADLVEQVTEREREELKRRESLYRGDRPPVALEGSEVVLVDDGLATGATMRVAIRALRARDVARVVVAVPLGAPDVCMAIEREADQTMCLETPEPFGSVGRWYTDFPQTGDDEVTRLLEAAARYIGN
ncbi:MAG: phosphoribosyltransferase family protein [Trueperaceae bacterium]